MKQGYWFNYGSGETFLIHEHEQWIRDEANARKLGIPEASIAAFRDFEPRTDRIPFLTWVMQQAPVMRVRGHGISVTFEFWTRDLAAPLALIRTWADNNAGPQTNLHITNLADHQTHDVRYQDLAQWIDTLPGG